MVLIGTHLGGLLSLYKCNTYLNLQNIKALLFKKQKIFVYRNKSSRLALKKITASSEIKYF
jgi:hypothetical protein